MSREFCRKASLCVAAFLAVGLGAQAQRKFDSIQRERARNMLRDMANAVRKNYYDSHYHGVDIEAQFKAADEKIQNATTLGQAFTAIAAALDSLNDSHTFFLPPRRPLRLEYGYEDEMIGDSCFVTAVRPKTDAAGKLHPGDQILTIEGFRPERETLWKMNYYFNQLFPRMSLHLKVQDPSGSQRQVEVFAKTRQLQRVLDLTASSEGGDIWQLVRESEDIEHYLRQRYIENGDALMIWKMPQFDLSDNEVDEMFDKARKHKTLILDLRGNPGGAVDTLERMAGNLFEHDVTIAKRTGRKNDMKPQMAKGRGSRAFTGKLIVLVDSGSASAAELFAHTVQLEHRGTVLGDRSSGSVMEAKPFRFEQGADTIIRYGASITDADLIMADGKSLEHTGVTPDELMLTTAADMAAGRDPVMARAVELAGLHLDAAGAGKLFPIEWMPD